MRNNVQLKNAMESAQKQQELERMRQMNEDYLSVINFKNSEKQRREREMRELDAQIVNRDQRDYENYQKIIEDRKKMQKELMSAHLDQSIQLKRKIAGRNEALDKERDDYQFLGGVGRNYGKQLER